MSKIIFNEHQRRQIEANPNVASVSDCAIQYTAEFSQDIRLSVYFVQF